MRIHTELKLIEGDFDKINFYLKSPPSDLRQKIKCLSASFPFKEIPERWSTVFKFQIPRSGFNRDDANDVDIFTIDMDYEVLIADNPYHLTKNVKLAEARDNFKLNDNLTDYLSPCEYVKSDRAIIDLVNEIIDNSEFFWSAVQKLANWVNLRIIYDSKLRDDSYQGSLQTIQSKRAICADFVHLFLALTRASGIPSRAVIGLAKQIRSGQWESHSWSEVYDPKYGWTPIDIVVQPVIIADIGFFYIKRSIGYNCIDRMYAYHFDSNKDQVKIKVEQRFFIGKDEIQIPIDNS